MATHAVKFTYEDYLLFPEDGRRHEIIDGEHFVTPSPNTKHQSILANLHRVIGPFVRRKKLGRLFSAPFDVVFSDLDVVQPDMLFVSTSRLSVLTDKNVQGAPDLVVEILSDSTRRKDEIIKRKLYERFGVAEYWIIDPEIDTVKVYRAASGHYDRVAELSLSPGDSLTTPLLHGFVIPLSEIFE